VSDIGGVLIVRRDRAGAPPRGGLAPTGVACSGRGAENRAGARFFGECGSAFASRCPRCGSPLESGRKDAEIGSLAGACSRLWSPWRTWGPGQAFQIASRRAGPTSGLVLGPYAGLGTERAAISVRRSWAHDGRAGEPAHPRGLPNWWTLCPVV